MKGKVAVTWFSFMLAAACSGPEQQPRPDFVRQGEPAPQIALSGLINAPVTRLNGIEELRDKVVVLEFWASWFGPCVDNIPRFNALAEKFRDKPVVFISITDEAEDTVAKFLKTTPIKGWIAPGAVAEVFRAYRVFTRPHTVIVGRDSRVAAITLPHEVTEERLNILLAGQIPAFQGSREEPARPASGTASAMAEFYIGEPLNGESTAEYGRGYYAGHNAPLLNALDYFYRDAAKIDASKAAMAVLKKRYELRVRLSAGRGDGLGAFFADGVKTAFGLRFKMVNKDAPVYLLKQARSGAKGFTRTASLKSSVRADGAGFKAEKMPLSALCGVLKDKIDLPLVDETGLKGEYDYSFKTGSEDLPGLNTALIDQLGLRLMPAKRRIAVLEVR